MVFDHSYQLFGMELACEVMQVSSYIDIEVELYKYLQWAAKRNEIQYRKINTVDQIGMPDVLLLKKEQYWLIEGKLLGKNALESLKDDIHYEFGQLAFALKAWKTGCSYMLAVGKAHELAFIYDKENRTCQSLINMMRKF